MDFYRPLTFGRALAMGVSQLRAVAPTLVVFGANAVSVFGGVVAIAALIHQLHAAHLESAIAVAGGFLTASIIAALIRALALGGAIGLAADRLAAEPPVHARSFFEHAVSFAQETLGYAVVYALLQLLVSAWRILSVVVGGWLYVDALIDRSNGFAGSAALALSLAGGVFLSAFVAVWADVSLVRSVHHREPYTHALVEAFGVITARPFSYIGLFFITGVFAFATELLVSTLVGLAPSAGDSLAAFAVVSGYGQLVSGLIVALAAALLELMRLYAFVALSLDDSGELPRQKVPPIALHSTPVPLSAELIIDAEPIPPKPTR